MYPNLMWLLTVAWPLEDQAYCAMTQDERDNWSAVYKACIATGRYHPFNQTCWY